MPPKKADGTSAASKAKPTHGTYQDMITDAIIALKDRNGSSRVKLKKYVKANNNITVASDAVFDAQFNKALRAGVEKGVFEQPKGPSGGTKLAKKAKVAPKKDVPKKKVVAPKKDAEKKKAVPKKKAAAPKEKKAAAPKKEVGEKKAAPKKAAAVPKEKKAAAPKKETKEKKEPLKKTAGGRVSKPKAAAPKKAATPKKAAPKKKAAAAA